MFPASEQRQAADAADVAAVGTAVAAAAVVDTQLNTQSDPSSFHLEQIAAAAMAVGVVAGTAGVVAVAA